MGRSRSRSRSRSPIAARRRRSRSRDRDHRRGGGGGGGGGAGIDRDVIITRDTRRIKERSRSRERDRIRRDRGDKDRPRRDHDRRRSRSRSRSRSSTPPRDRGGRRGEPDADRKEGAVGSSGSKGPSSISGTKDKPILIDLDDDDMEGKSQEEIDMMKMMGFAGFDSSKGKHVDGNDVSAVHHVIRRKYRQYMNRRGGFNRPLDFVN